jgi:tripartite-type tricarboxylate transporter receptor subunit TctC
MRKFIGLLTVAAFSVALIPVLALSASQAQAQSYPTKKISWIVFGGKGGGGDRWSRILASTAEDHFGQPWRVENITGASGVAAWKEMLSRPADGHTIFLGSPSTNIAVLKQPKPPVNVKRDIKIVGYISAWGAILVSKPKQKWSDWKGFKAYAEKNPGKLTIGGSEAVNMGIAYMLGKAGIRDKVTFVPYSSTSKAVADFLGGHITLMGSTSSTAKTLIPKKAVAIANTGSIDELKGVPNAKELGYSGIVFPRWVGVHPDTPDAIADSISTRLGKLLKDKSVTRLIKKIGEKIVFLPRAKASPNYEALVDGIKGMTKMAK